LNYRKTGLLSGGRDKWR